MVVCPTLATTREIAELAVASAVRHTIFRLVEDRDYLAAAQLAQKQGWIKQADVYANAAKWYKHGSLISWRVHSGLSAEPEFDMRVALGLFTLRHIPPVEDQREDLTRRTIMPLLVAEAKQLDELLPGLELTEWPFLFGECFDSLQHDDVISQGRDSPIYLRPEGKAALARAATVFKTPDLYAVLHPF
ncbi:MAG TPA: hypothetical protein VJJ82_00155 [Candidatus Nanoarchaeia archaeon]|nr:hypothetical protein [Candidatus Nanoarchaeia archaeon]